MVLLRGTPTAPFTSVIVSETVKVPLVGKVVVNVVVQPAVLQVVVAVEGVPPVAVQTMVYGGVPPMDVAVQLIGLPAVAVVQVSVLDGGGTIRPGLTWLSRFPIEAPSSAWTLIWNGAPDMDADPKPVPQPVVNGQPAPAGVVPLQARCPPQRKRTLVELGDAGRVILSVMSASSSLAPDDANETEVNVPNVVPVGAIAMIYLSAAGSAWLPIEPAGVSAVHVVVHSTGIALDLMIEKPAGGVFAVAQIEPENGEVVIPSHGLPVRAVCVKFHLARES